MSDVPTHVQNTVVTQTAEVQTVTVKAKKGTFKLNYGGEVSAAIKYNASASEVQTALNQLGGAPSTATVSGGPGDETGSKPYTVTFAASSGNVQALTADTTGLEEGSKEVLIATSTQGDANEVQRGTKPLADATGRTSPLAGESPVTYREGHSSTFD